MSNETCVREREREKQKEMGIGERGGGERGTNCFLSPVFAASSPS